MVTRCSKNISRSQAQESFSGIHTDVARNIQSAVWASGSKFHSQTGGQGNSLASRAS